MRRLGDSVYLYPGSPSTLLRVVDGGAVLVDPGHGSGRHKDLKRELRKLGLELKAQLATHGHADHVAVSPRLEAPLFVHRFEFSIAESPLSREILTFGSRAPRGFLPFSAGEVKVHAIFEWGDELFGLKAIKLNGHSPGMTGFLDEENGVLYAGDSFFGEKLIGAVGVPYLVDWALFKGSLERLKDFTGETLLIPSHGKPVRGDEALELLDFNLNRLGEVEKLALEFLERPMTVEELALRLMNHYRVEVTPQRLALNLVPVRALIAELYNNGLVEVTIKGGLKWVVKKN